jgi:hypothetical protein
MREIRLMIGGKIIKGVGNCDPLIIPHNNDIEGWVGILKPIPISGSITFTLMSNKKIVKSKSKQPRYVKVYIS